MRPRRLVRRVGAAASASALAAVLLCACAPADDAAVSGPADGDASAPSAAAVALPPEGARPDYQLGGSYDPAPGVGVVARDRTAEPADGLYSICYVNGFQTQPGELDEWPEDALLRSGGEPVIDPGWPDEVLLDTSSAQTRGLILETVTPWIDGCAAAGFDAVEFDNLDTYTRSDGALEFEDNLALARDLVAVAHAAGLAAGQKNAVEDADALRTEAGFDFAIVEECAAFAECGEISRVYGGAVIDIEYTDQLPRSFADVCADPETPVSTVLRDRDLVARGDPSYAFETC